MLLMVTSRTRKRWIMPKGLLKPGESHLDGCQRELMEEAGASGIVLLDYPLTSITTKKKDKLTRVPVTYYPLLVTASQRRWQEDSFRKRKWVKIGDAADLVKRKDMKQLINYMEQLRPWLKKASKPSKTRKQ